MPELAQFDRYDSGAALGPPILIVGAECYEQRIVLITPDGGGWRIAAAGGKASAATAYNLEGMAESVMLAPGQVLWAQPTASPRRLSVYVAPREDDYFESGGNLCHDGGL